MLRELSAAAIFFAIASPALAASVQIAPDVKITEAGAQAVVSGTLQCTNGDTAYLYAAMAQVQNGGKLVTGSSGSVYIGCTGGSQNWEAVLLTVIPFKPGPATAAADVYTSFEGDVHTAEQVKVSRSE